MPYEILHIMLIMHKSSYPYCSIIIYNLRVQSIIYYNIMYEGMPYAPIMHTPLVVVCILIVFILCIWHRNRYTSSYSMIHRMRRRARRSVCKIRSYVTTLVLLVVVYAYYIIIIGGQSGGWGGGGGRNQRTDKRHRAPNMVLL